MSQASAPTIDRSPLAVEERAAPPNIKRDASLLKHSEKLRHILPRSSRRFESFNRADSSRVSKSNPHRNTFLYRQRGNLHRVINSFFGNEPEQGAHRTSPRVRSRASSFGSKPASSVYGSVLSLDLISPGAFLFSGPDLPSAGPFTSSTSRLQILAGSFDSAQPLRHGRSSSFSIVENVSANDETFEPIANQGETQSMSDVLLGIDTSIEEIGDSPIENSNGEAGMPSPMLFRGDDIAREAPRSSSSAHKLLENPAITSCILRCTDSTTWKCLRLSCRHWHSAIGPSRYSIRSASTRMPTELLIDIFALLRPKDFNAARRTCRGWMAASLNKRLLSAMLLRGGWGSCDNLRDGQLERRCSVSSSSDVWELSRALSRECALSSRWTGNGLDTRPAMVESTDIDFSEMGSGHTLHTEQTNSSLLFTPSVCGNFLLVAKGALVIIYGMGGGLVQPLTSVVCPRKVLALSMNASVGRDAVAALLEGRMGMVCELRDGRSSAQTAAGSGDMCVEGDGHPPRPASQPNVSLEDNNDLQHALDSAEYTSPRILHSYPRAQGLAFSSFNAIELRAHSQGFWIRDTDDSSTYDRHHINNTWNLDMRGPQTDLRASSGDFPSAQSVSIESGTSTFYRHLCSEDDPPRNVSICPQRRCVAFGCSASIELYWIDALTGQSLSRWFPLTSPSDYLYFLSPRPGLESAKKLRLISSAAHPIDRPAISRRLLSGSATRSFWGSVGFEGRYRQFHACDHYHAIPLSDGHHILFVDPSNNRLTLGCDAPLGGPAKLLHKVVFISPEENTVPRTYTAASDLSSGARIVVMYGDALVLYSIPVDVLALSRTEQAAESWDVYNAAPFSPTGRYHDHWLNWWDEPVAFDPKFRSEAVNDSPIWPIALSGTVIGNLANVCELTIQTRPDIIIWAFTSTSQCKTWRLRNYVDPVVRSKQVIDQGGLTREVYNMDGSGDAIMQDASFTSLTDKAVRKGTREGHDTGPATENPSRVDLDGNSPGVLKVLPRALAVENDRWVDSIDIVSCTDAWFEGGGDVVTWYEA